eukprot:1356405-Amorphochlora_amoeboformis.AAC.1
MGLSLDPYLPPPQPTVLEGFHPRDREAKGESGEKWKGGTNGGREVERVRKRARGKEREERERRKDKDERRGGIRRGKRLTE